MIKHTPTLTILSALVACAGMTHAATVAVTAEAYTGYNANSPFFSTFGALSELDGVGTPAEATSVYDFRALTATVATDSTYFFLEDLQDGQFDTPGATLTATHVRTGDGINGSTNSRSNADNVAEDLLRRSSIRATPNALRVDFNSVSLGGNLPTHVGVVFVEQNNAPTLTAFRSDDTVIGTATFAAGTADDDFVGLIADEGIAYITATGDVEYDHFQYGFNAVPEPSSAGKITTVTESSTSALLGLGGFTVILQRRK